METEKETAMWRFRRLLHIGRLLRFLELAGALVVLSYSYSYIPPIARNSGAFFRRAVVVLISPTFVFLFGNAIVLVLFAKSGQIPSTAEAPSALSDVDGSDEISSKLTLREDDEVEYEDKEVCVEIRVCTQSRSEELERANEEPKIRESKTEVSCDAEKFSPPPPPPPPPAFSEVKGAAGEDRAAAEAEEDAERFRRTVEEFIAKQQWFQRQESLSHISYSAGLPEPVAV